MNVLVRGKGIKVSTALHDHITRRLYFALGRFGQAIDHVDVQVGNGNGRQGVGDKRCHILVKVRGSGTYVTDTYDFDLHAAVDQTAGRIGRTVARALDRRYRARRNRQREARVVNRSET